MLKKFNPMPYVEMPFIDDTRRICSGAYARRDQTEHESWRRCSPSTVEYARPAVRGPAPWCVAVQTVDQTKQLE